MKTGGIFPAMLLGVLLVAPPAAEPAPARNETRLPITEMSAAEHGSRVEEITAPDGVRIPVRVFGDAGTGTPVVMTHGIMSHSRWFVQSARFLADLGMPVYAMDRRGSGLSEAPRGDMKDFREMTGDIRAVVEEASKRHGKSRAHVVGHCFGVIPASAFAAEHAELVESLVLATPALYTRVEPGLLEQLGLGLCGFFPCGQRLAIPLGPEMLTDLEPYRDFIRGDPLILKEVTASFYLQVPNAQGFIRDHAQRLTMPLFVAFAEQDTICDNAQNRAFFETLPAERKTLLSYPNARHIIEFSEDKNAFFADLREWFQNLPAAKS